MNRTIPTPSCTARSHRISQTATSQALHSSFVAVLGGCPQSIRVAVCMIQCTISLIHLYLSWKLHLMCSTAYCLRKVSCLLHCESYQHGDSEQRAFQYLLRVLSLFPRELIRFMKLPAASSPLYRPIPRYLV